MYEEVILVSEEDEEVGTVGKLEAHQQGLLHRAISVFIFHPDGRMLLQRRAFEKYHSGGLWSNACCSHPRPGESVSAAAARRLFEEMGISCPLQEVFSFMYRTSFPNGLIEHEYDHVFIGTYAQDPVPDPTEADEWKWQSVESIWLNMKEQPEHYTYWFTACFIEVIEAARKLKLI